MMATGGHSGRFDDAVARETGVIEHRSSRLRHGRGRSRMTLNLTAMIDVTFLLLVYFLVATEFKVGEAVYQLDLPPRLQSDAQRDPFQLDEQPLRVNVSSTPSDARGYRLAIEGPFPQPGTFEELYAFLRDQQIRPESARGLFETDHPIIIVPARTARWDHVIDALNAARRASYTNINFAKPS